MKPSQVLLVVFLLQVSIWKLVCVVSASLIKMSSDDFFLFWGSGSSPCWRPMIVLEEKGLGGYPNKLIEFSKQEHKGEDVKKLNPRGQVNLIYFLRINVHTQSVFKCSKSKMEAGIFIANFKQISHVVLVFPLLTLNK